MGPLGGACVATAQLPGAGVVAGGIARGTVRATGEVVAEEGAAVVDEALGPPAVDGGSVTTAPDELVVAPDEAVVGDEAVVVGDVLEGPPPPQAANRATRSIRT
jgi:hypothetical protein